MHWGLRIRTNRLTYGLQSGHAISSRNLWKICHARAPASGSVFSQAPQVVWKHTAPHRGEGVGVGRVKAQMASDKVQTAKRALSKALAVREARTQPEVSSPEADVGVVWG